MRDLLAARTLLLILMLAAVALIGLIAAARERR
jgi:hypothetical protein